MSDLIRRQDVIDAIKQFSTDNIRLRNGLMELANHMELIPSADSVEVVRCKDCKWFCEFCDKYKQESRKDGMCEHPKFGRYTLDTTFDYYCADGERRSE